MEHLAAAAAASYTPPFVHIWIMVTPVRSIPLLDRFESVQEPFCLIQKIAVKNCNSSHKSRAPEVCYPTLPACAGSFTLTNRSTVTHSCCAGVGSLFSDPFPTFSPAR